MLMAYGDLFIDSKVRDAMEYASDSLIVNSILSLVIKLDADDTFNDELESDDPQLCISNASPMGSSPSFL